ncbi:hypothetical protein AS9A_0073 [Hoyosella subflava DQS3-9A1]|uniref:Uncharacterized protein n=1 Tax=Hoyosella subflava (strain DSM 45089 / JCM 17490 / NBRC 109087 / DQS3-9A1) TaxID=443218 RepID=F6ERL3_HOYSD|nr:hypothetical protein AS9A_0073 [Hoyosella subflava DQS3-9A1]
MNGVLPFGVHRSTTHSNSTLAGCVRAVAWNNRDPRVSIEV